MRINFLSIFLDNFRSPGKTGFPLKSCARKLQVIMVHCGPNLQTSRVIGTWNGTVKQCNVQVASDWKIKVYRLEPFWWRIFPSFNCGENKTIGALSSEFYIQIMGFKQLPRLHKTKKAIYSTPSEPPFFKVKLSSFFCFAVSFCRTVKKLSDYFLNWFSQESFVFLSSVFLNVNHFFPEVKT